MVDKEDGEPVLNTQVLCNSVSGLMDTRPLDLDTHLMFARPAASPGFWIDLKPKHSSEEKMETVAGTTAINKIHSQKGFQWSGLLHPLPRQGAGEHHTWQEK